MTTAPVPRFAVALLGARRRYAVPRILQRAEMLERLFTDVCLAGGAAAVVRAAIPAALRPAAVRRLLDRSPTGIPAARVTAFHALGVRYALRLRRTRPSVEPLATYLWVGRKFCRQVCAHGFGVANAVYVFNSAGLEILDDASRRGLYRVMEQTIAPRSLEVALTREERERFPGWTDATKVDPAVERDFTERERAEWRQSDVVLCPSEFVAEAVAAEGVPRDRVRVVPYGCDGLAASAATPVTRPAAGRPLRALFAGGIGLRKGVGDFALAMRELKGRGVEARAVGPILLTPAGVAAVAGVIDVRGPVPHSSMAAHYAWADVLVLPSVCEGSAMVVYEALAAGRPVLATPNAGTVVRDGLDGFIIPPRRPDLLAGRLARLAADRALLADMSASAQAISAEYSVACYQERLTAALRAGRPGAGGAVC